MAPSKRKAALVRDAAAEVVAAAFKGKGFPQAELHKVFASHSSRNEDGVWVVNEALLSGRQGAAWRTLKAHLATLEQDKAIIALHNVASSMSSNPIAVSQELRNITKRHKLGGSASPAPSTVPAASSTASPAPPKTPAAPPKTPAASSDGLAASKDDTKPKSALRTTQKTLNMDSDAPVKSAAPTPPSFKSPGPAVAPMAAATHQVNWTPPPSFKSPGQPLPPRTPSRVTTPQSMPPRTPIRLLQATPTRTPRSMPPPHREAKSSEHDDELLGPLPLSQSTGSSESSQEFHMALSAQSPVPVSARASVPPATPAPAPPPPATLDTLQAAIEAQGAAMMASIEALGAAINARFNRNDKELQAMRIRLDGGGILEQIGRVSLVERPDSNLAVQRAIAKLSDITDILKSSNTMSADDKAKFTAIIKKVDDLSEQLQAADAASRAAVMQSIGDLSNQVQAVDAATRAAILARMDDFSGELEATRRATATTILESKHKDMPTSFMYTEHRIDPAHPVVPEPSAEFLAGQRDGFLYIVDERTGLPILDHEHYPLVVPHPEPDDREKFICSLLGPCNCGIKFMKAAKAVATVVPALGAAVPILESALNGLKAVVMGAFYTEDVLSRTFEEIVRAGDPDGNYAGVVQHARDDGSVFWAQPLDVQATPTTNEPAAPGANDA